MATTSQKVEAERRMRSLLEQSQLPQPDAVEYGETCIRLFWNDIKQTVIVQIDEPPPGWKFAEDLTAEELERLRRGEALEGEDDLPW